MRTAEELRARAAEKRAEIDRLWGRTGVTETAAICMSHSAAVRNGAATDRALVRCSDLSAQASGLEDRADRIEARAAEAARVRLTRDDITGATAIRTRSGWHRVVRVNATTVTVATPYSWTDRYPFDRVCLRFADFRPPRRVEVAPRTGRPRYLDSPPTRKVNHPMNVATPVSEGPNVELFIDVLAQIEKHPETWDQRQWRCGTGMCFAGWTCELSNAKWRHPKPLGNQGDYETVDGDHVWDMASRLLGFDGVAYNFSDADGLPTNLFNSGNTLDDLYLYSADILGLDVEVLRDKVAARVADGQVQP